jgi:hypothetical protein
MSPRLSGIAVATCLLAGCSNSSVPLTERPSVIVGEVVLLPDTKPLDVAACMSHYVARRGLRPRTSQHLDPEHVHVTAFSMRRRGNLGRAIFILDIAPIEGSREMVLVSRRALPSSSAEWPEDLRHTLSGCGFVVSHVQEPQVPGT